MEIVTVASSHLPELEASNGAASIVRDYILPTMVRELANEIVKKFSAQMQTHELGFGLDRRVEYRLSLAIGDPVKVTESINAKAAEVSNGLIHDVHADYRRRMSRAEASIRSAQRALSAAALELRSDP